MKIWLSSLVMCFFILPAISSAELQDGDLVNADISGEPDQLLFYR